jgi:chemotaxis protein MotB
MIDEESSGSGTPAWVVTFADLMSLLMCFFVLLLSFSEIDAQKFRQIAGELSQAFGVQRDVPVEDVPTGSSIAFSELLAESGSAMAALERTDAERLTEATAAALRESLAHELRQGQIQLDEGPRRLVLRVQEQGSFPSGSASVTPAFEDLLRRMAGVLARVPGVLTIEGHTDDVPIRNERFESNWDLSAARAAAVANTLLRHAEIDPARLQVQGHAETRPRESNDSPEQRARNRRVEIIIDQSGDLDDLQRELERLREAAGTLQHELEASSRPS